MISLEHIRNTYKNAGQAKTHITKHFQKALYKYKRNEDSNKILDNKLSNLKINKNDESLNKRDCISDTLANKIKYLFLANPIYVRSKIFSQKRMSKADFIYQEIYTFNTIDEEDELSNNEHDYDKKTIPKIETEIGTMYLNKIKYHTIETCRE